MDQEGNEKKEKKKNTANNLFLVFILLCILIAAAIYFRKELLEIFQTFLGDTFSAAESGDLIS